MWPAPPKGDFTLQDPQVRIVPFFTSISRLLVGIAILAGPIYSTSSSDNRRYPEEYLYEWNRGENTMKSPINIEAFQRILESDDQEGLLEAILRLGTIDDSEELTNAVRFGPAFGSWSGWSW